MPVLSLSEAARRAGVDRSTIRRKLHQGELSATPRPDGSQGVELSELARLYPHVVAAPPPTSAPPGMSHHVPPDDLTPIQREVEVLKLRQEVEMLRRELERAQEDKRWMQQRMEAWEQRLLPAPRRGWVERLGELVERLRRR